MKQQNQKKITRLSIVSIKKDEKGVEERLLREKHNLDNNEYNSDLKKDRII